MSDLNAMTAQDARDFYRRWYTPANAAAAAPLSASGTWGPLLLTKDPDTLPGKVRSYFLDVKPGYTDDPTRAFYNHVWLIGDQEEINSAELRLE